MPQEESLPVSMRLISVVSAQAVSAFVRASTSG